MDASIGVYTSTALYMLFGARVMTLIPPWNRVYGHLRFRYQWTIIPIYMIWGLFSGTFGEGFARGYGETYNHPDGSLIDQLTSVVIIITYSVYKFVTYETNDWSIWKKNSEIDDQSE